MNDLSKFVKIGVGAFILIFCLVTFFMAERDSEVFMTTYALYLSYILSFLAIGAVLLGGVLSLMANPKSAITTLAGLAGVGVLFGISYGITSGEAYLTVDAATSHFIAALLMMTYLCLGLAVLGILYLIVSAAIK